MLVLTINIGVSRASLDFGSRPTPSGTGTPTTTPTTSTAQTSSGVTVDLLGLQGTFDLAVDVLGLLSGNFRVEPTGAWGIRVASLEAEIPNVARLTAEGIIFHYDPNHDAEADGPQELLRINTATIVFPSLGVTGSLRPYDPTAKQNVNAAQDDTLAAGVVPGLVIYDNGFKLGTAELAYGLPPMPAGGIQPGNALTPTGGSAGVDQDINLFGILTLKDLRVGVQGLSVFFDGSDEAGFTGTIYVATGGATLFPGKAFTATISDRLTSDDLNPDGTPNTEALRAQLTFSNGQVDSFQLFIDTMSVKLGEFVSLNARDFVLDTGAEDDEFLVEVPLGRSDREDRRPRALR